jgi:hypothetical protein
MKTRPRGIFSRIGLFVFFVIAALGVLFVMVTYTATSEYYQASTQLLNKDVAERIAKLVSPFNKDGIDHMRADSVFNSTMIISPNTEIYFLDTTGMVRYYYALDIMVIELYRINCSGWFATDTSVAVVNFIYFKTLRGNKLVIL